jgi:predicted tellurium resistance membrane protein TerC
MDAEIIISLLSLIALEAVLGIDNVIFISILAGRLPASQQKKARKYGLILAGLLRLGLLLVISFILKLDKDLFQLLGYGFSGKDLVLLAGGLFLLYKSVKEIYHKMEGDAGDQMPSVHKNSFGQVIFQILLMDMVFSIDSIITAVGMVKEVWVMYVAVVATVLLMLVAAERIAAFVNKHPSFKMLALSFLLLIGFSLVSEGLGLEIPKGYIYFAMAFSFLVDIFQMRMHKSNSKPVQPREHYLPEEVPRDLKPGDTEPDVKQE